MVCLTSLMTDHLLICVFSPKMGYSMHFELSAPLQYNSVWLAVRKYKHQVNSELVDIVENLQK